MNLTFLKWCLPILCILHACSPSKNAPYLEDQFDQAVAFDDNWTALYYLHEIRALQPNNNTVYTRLADIYAKTGNHTGALKAADIALKKANKLEKKDLLFVKVRSYKGLGKRLEAIAVLDSLVTIDKERALEYLYETAVLYFEFSDLANAQMRMEQVLRHPSAMQTQKELNSDLGLDQVNYYLAASNFIGYIKIATGDFVTAEQIYQAIFRQTETFKLAQNNYQLLQQKKKLSKKKE